MSGAVSEQESRLYSLVAVVESLKWMVASLAVAWIGVEPFEPKVADVGLDFALEPKNSWHADHVLVEAGPMVVGTEPGQVLVPMDSNWLETVLEVVLGLLASKVAELGLELVMKAMHQLKAAVAVEAELRPKVVEVDLKPGLVAMLVVEPDAVVAEPMVAVAGVAGILVEPVEPREVVLGIFAGVVASMVVAAECLSVMAVPMGPGLAAALVLEVDPKLVAFAADVAAHESASRVAEPVAEAVAALESGPRMAEDVSGVVLALEADSRMAEFEGSKYLWGVEAVPGSE